MNESQITTLVEEIEVVSFTEFWWGNPLLERASQVCDARVIRALALRHHGLSNKSAFSAHVIRNAIKLSDGPEFRTLWSFIDTESDARAIVERMDDFDYIPWAATFILGEVGGAHVFASTTARLTPPHQPRYHLLVRLLSHIVVRYLQIAEDTKPQSTMIDLNTGEATKVATTGPAYEMEMTKRTQANEYFTPLSAAIVADAKRKLQSIPDSVFNYPKPQFLHALDCLQTRNA